MRILLLLELEQYPCEENVVMNNNADPQPILLREDTQGVATLTLNRPAQFNALSKDLLNALQAELTSYCC
jgi:hypothetical protein